MEVSAQEYQADKLSKVRRRQWIYLGPIIAAPAAHIAVSSLRHVKTERGRKIVIGVGVIGATLATVGMRLYLMRHAGYAAGERAHTERIGTSRAGSHAEAHHGFHIENCFLQ
jgi:hypothetical protein